MFPPKYIKDLISFYGSIVTVIGFGIAAVTYMADAKQTKSDVATVKTELTETRKENKEILANQLLIQKSNKNIQLKLSGIDTVLKLHIKDTKEEINYWKYIPRNQSIEGKKNLNDSSYYVISQMTH